VNTVDVLRGAKELLSDPDRWGRGHMYEVGVGQPSRWCALGALLHVAGGGPAYAHAHSVMCRTINGVVPTWNDNPNTTHADLIDAFDRAILCLAPETQAEPLEAVSA
jgi:hypothetical protein